MSIGCGCYTRPRMNAIVKARWQIHAATFLWGWTSILGKEITLRALPLVWWRVLFTAAALAIVPGVWRGVASMPVRLRFGYAGAGGLLALHWVAFFGSVKLSNASVGATCLALSPACLALIEPVVGRRRFDARELALGVAVVPGVALVVGGVPSGMRAGVLVGVVAAVLAACFGAVNKRLAGRAPALAIVWLQLLAGVVLLLAVAPFAAGDGPSVERPDARNACELLVLALACTLLPFWLYQKAIQHLSAFTIQLTINLEPVYAIVLAVALFHEQRELGVLFYAGVAIVLAAVFGQPLLARASAT